MTSQHPTRTRRTQPSSTKALRVRTGVRAGGLNFQHNEALRVRTGVRAGGLQMQHNEALRVRARGG